MDDVIKKVLANILTIVNSSSLSESFIEAILNRLVSFGYILKEDDDWSICFAMQKVENQIKNSCNTTSIPDGLFHVAVDNVCGEFLFTKKATGKLEIDDIDFEGAVKQISEGDVTITFADGASDEDRFNQFINHLMTLEEGDLVCFRKLQW